MPPPLTRTPSTLPTLCRPLGKGRRCKCHLRRFGNTNDLSSLDLDLRTVGDAFVAEIKTIFEPWQLAEYLATARQTEPFDPDIYEGEDPEYIEMERQDDLRRSAAGRACQGVATEGRERVALNPRGAENPASPQPTPRTGQWLSSPSAASSPGTGAKTTNATRSSPRTTTCWNCTVPDSLPRMGRTRPRKLRDRIILVAGQLPRGDGGDGLRNPSSPSLALC